MSGMIKLKVKTVAMSQQGGFSLLLTDEEERNVLPIVIGAFEAQSIALSLEGKAAPRPLTHDLLVSFCEALGGTVKKIIVTDIREDTYYAEIQLSYNWETISIDSRPSDAIALALRVEAPIFMAPGLIEFTINYEDLISNSDEDHEES